MTIDWVDRLIALCLVAAFGLACYLLFLVADKALGAELRFQDPNHPANVRSYQALRNTAATGPTWVPAALAPADTPAPDLTPCTTPGGAAYRMPVTPVANNDRWKIRVTSVDGLVTDSCNDFQLPTPTATLAAPTAVPATAVPTLAMTPTLPPATGTPTKVKPAPVEMIP